MNGCGGGGGSVADGAHEINTVARMAAVTMVLVVFIDEGDMRG